MQHTLSQAAVFLLLVLTTFACQPTLRTTIDDDEITDCDTIVRVSHLCYQCSRRHEEQFNLMYINCCTGEPSTREYCDYIYTEPPKRGSHLCDSETMQGDGKGRKGESKGVLKYAAQGELF
ncbi:hypothetical protein BsWGS_10674 [Bradybaena similaris]